VVPELISVGLAESSSEKTAAVPPESPLLGRNDAVGFVKKAANACNEGRSAAFTPLQYPNRMMRSNPFQTFVPTHAEAG
jgi:hypothetical protein